MGETHISSSRRAPKPMGKGPGGVSLFEESSIWPSGRTSSAKHTDVGWGWGGMRPFVLIAISTLRPKSLSKPTEPK